MVAALPTYLKGKKVCIQAGGNWGYWPLLLSEIFETVYTFEPDHECFCCLAENTKKKENVVRFQAALGNNRKLVDLWRDVDTTGNQRIKGGGIYPTIRIDDLQLPSCDLIYLDIEGCEREAIRGALHTIYRCLPIIAFEHRNAFPEAKETMSLISSHGYRHVGAIGADMVMAPC